MKAVVAAFNQEKALVRAFSVIKKPLPINRLQLHLHKSAAADTSTEAGIQSLEIKCAISGHNVPAACTPVLYSTKLDTANRTSHHFLL